MEKRSERRQNPRMSLRVPVRVQGHDQDGRPWEEMSSSFEASFGGVSFPLHHEVDAGQVLLLSLPLPKSFRSYDLIDPSYRVYALVRNVHRKGLSGRVGVLFLGKSPPRGYDDNPGGRYLLPSDPPPKPKERRQHERHALFLNVWLKRIVDGARGQQEPTVTENVSKRGMRVPTTLPVAKGEILVARFVGQSFESRVEVKSVFIGKDNVPRLSLQLLDADLPDRLLR